MPNARCILPSRRRRRDIPRDGVCPAASGRQVMTSPIIKTWPEFVNALCSTCCFWPTRRPHYRMRSRDRALGLVLTASTTLSQSYNLARSLLTLDQVSRGRVGWNIVTTADAVASLNFGMTEMPSSDLRYEMAADFTAAVRALWDSWDDGALVGDVDTGVWADINRIHAVNYAGRHYTTAGPMQVWRSPQGQPVLVQAGSSPQGRDFAARVAEIVFSIQTRFEDAVASYADIKNRARQHGRDPRHLAILPGLSLVIGSTEAEAFARLSVLDELATGLSSIEAFAARLGVDPADLDPDKPFPEHLLAKLEGAQFKQRSAGVSSGHRAARYRLLQDRSVTVRQIVARGGGGHYRFVGTPEQIVDFMEKWGRGCGRRLQHVHGRLPRG